MNGKEFFMDSIIKRHRCLSAFTSYFIDYEGNLKLCLLIPALDNIKEEDLRDLL